MGVCDLVFGLSPSLARTTTILDTVFNLRNIVLLLAPLPVISGSMSLSNWAHDDPNRFATRNEVNVIDHRSPRAWSVPVERPWATDRDQELARRTKVLAQVVIRQLPAGDAAIVRTPLVIGGNIPPTQLNHWYEKTIAPAIESMRYDYLSSSIPDPISVLLFKDERSYREASERLFGERNVSIYGFFQPYSRTVVINLAAGGGTIVHELTHALLDYDFPDVPIWFNEGLASLHEHCDLEFRNGRPVIQPRLNWRLQVLQSALVEGRMLPTWEMMQQTRFDGRDQALLYAHARYFCYYLQEQGKLRDFYDCFRAEHHRDPQGDGLIRRFFPGKTWPQVERGFRTWVLSQTPA